MTDAAWRSIARRSDCGNDCRVASLSKSCRNLSCSSSSTSGSARTASSTAAISDDGWRSSIAASRPAENRSGSTGGLREPGWCSRRLPAALLWIRTLKLLGQQFLPAYSLSFVSTAVHIFLGFDKTRVSPNGS
jgi:hypothetical protein